MGLIASQSITCIIENHVAEMEDYREKVTTKIISFLCKLRSHHIIEIEGLKSFLNTELRPYDFSGEVKK